MRMRNEEFGMRNAPPTVFLEPGGEDGNSKFKIQNFEFRIRNFPPPTSLQPGRVEGNSKFRIPNSEFTECPCA